MDFVFNKYQIGQEVSNRSNLCACKANDLLISNKQKSYFFFTNTLLDRLIRRKKRETNILLAPTLHTILINQTNKPCFINATIKCPLKYYLLNTNLNTKLSRTIEINVCPIKYKTNLPDLLRLTSMGYN